MVKRLLLVTGTILTSISLVIALVVPANAMHYHGRGNSVSADKRCSEPYKAVWGYKDILDKIPFAKAEWTSDSGHCGFQLEVRVQFTTKSVPSQTKYTNPSGPVKAINLWSERDAPYNTLFDKAQIRFNTGNGWGSWCKLTVPLNC